LGTPDEDVWPGVTCLQDWNDKFPVWSPLQLSSYVPSLDADGLDLLEVFFF
jgi:hypothetical protein